MSLTAYIRYDQTGRIVPGGPIVVKDKPAVGNWQPVIAGTNVTLSGQLRAFVKLDRYNKPLASTLFLGYKRPASGKWLEVNATYTLQNATYYNVAGCERMEYHVIKYTGSGVLTEGTIVNNATPECWFVVDQSTGPEDVGTVAYVWNTPFDCQPCINSHTTTTTTTAPPYAYSFNILWVPPGETFFSAGGCSIPVTVVYSTSSSLTSGTRLYRYYNLTDELETGGEVWKQILPLGQPNNFAGGTYVEGSGIYAFNGYTMC